MSGSSPKSGNTTSMREAIRFVIAQGGAVVPVVRSGELEFSLPAWLRSYRGNGRKKDVPGVLKTALRRIS